MATYEALVSQVRRFLAGSSLIPLREWIEDNDEAVSESTDERLRELDSDVWSLVSRGDLGELNEAGIRNALAAQYPDLAPPMVTEVTGTASVRWVADTTPAPMLVTGMNVFGTGTLRRESLTPT